MQVPPCDNLCQQKFSVNHDVGQLYLSSSSVFLLRHFNHQRMKALLNHTAILFSFLFVFSCASVGQRNNPDTVESRFVKMSSSGRLEYIPDEKGNIIPDFSRVGYYSGDRDIPDVPVVKTIIATGNSQDRMNIQQAINEVSRMKASKDGFRGAILLKKGKYQVDSTIVILSSGVVLRGEGDTENGTRIFFTASKKLPLFSARGNGSLKEIAGTRQAITDGFVAVGATSFSVASADKYKAGDKVVVYRPATQQWIDDIQMSKIEERKGTIQWKPEDYNLSFERMITKVEGSSILIDNPVVMEMEPKYGGGYIFKYDFDGRINNVGIENLYMESAYESDTAENHGWDAISYQRLENGWVRNVTARYFGYSCVNLGSLTKNISVLNSKCLDAKSVITGGRRYSFNNDGQLNLFMNCYATEGRHDFVTGKTVLGPNVFVNCTAERTHADIGPHHRWAVGTLYDNIVTDGAINIHDRGNWGTGHGWPGVNQYLWNCTAKQAAVQSPWVSGKNYAIGFKGKVVQGRLKGRPQGEWDAQGKTVKPVSLYQAQLKERKK